MTLREPRLLWSPSERFIETSNLKRYTDWLSHQYNVQFTDYEELWKWSVADVSRFWESIWRYFKVEAHSPCQNVLKGSIMPDFTWFEGATLNYAEHIFRNKTLNHPALIYKCERNSPKEISWNELESRVASLSQYFKDLGLKSGDSVAAFLPNIPQASIGFLAACSNGLVWSSCSPDFGVKSVVERFKQIKPKVLLVCDGYTYNGKPYSKMAEIAELKAALPSLKNIILIPFLDESIAKSEFTLWEETQQNNAKLSFYAVPFNHPIWVLYSSGTTGAPKAITHSHGGVLLEHFKYLVLQNDVKPGERFFWYSTTGWMMWNFLHASLLAGATAVLYEGGAGYPQMSSLWEYAAEVKINHFGTSAPFVVACMKKNLSPGKQFNLSALRSIGSTGAPLPPEGFDWVYENIKKDIWLCSMSGGTDVCTAFVGGSPWKPVFEGEIQCRALGCDLQAFDDAGKILINQVGEMVIRQPMPSMPIYFWNDEDGSRYRDSYFAMYEGLWRHGDWVEVATNGSVVIYGRSDATLNRHGVRIGTAEIYRVVNKVKGIKDSLIINFELPNGNHYMPLFVTLNEGKMLTSAIQTNINTSLKGHCSPRHVPDEIIQVQAIPYTISGKKMEAPAKQLVLGLKEPNLGAMRNPESMAFFRGFSKHLQSKT